MMRNEDTKANHKAQEALISTALDWHRVPGIGLEVQSTPACRAVEIAFRHLGVDVGSLVSLSDAQTLKDATNLLGRGRGVMARAIDLEPNWWRTNGEIIAVNHDELGPCTLIPRGSGWKAIVPAKGPETRDHLNVDAAFASRCDTVAYEFLRIPQPGRTGILELLKLATFKRWGEIRARIFAGIVSALLGLVIPIVTAIMINQVIPDGESSGVVGIGLALLVAAIATTILGLVGGLATLRFDNSIAFRTETIVLNRVLDRFTRDKSLSDGEVIQRISSVNTAMGTLTHSTDKVVVEGIRGFAHLILLLYYSWVLALVALVTLVVGLVAIFIEASLQNRFVAASQEASGKSQSLSIMMLEGLDSIRDRDIAEPLLLRWTAQRSRLSNLMYLSSTLANIRTLLLTLLGGSITLLVYFLVAGHYAGDLNSGNFVASTIAIAAVMSSLGKTAGVFAAIATISPVFARLTPLLKSSEKHHMGNEVPADADFDFAFEDVTIKATEWGRRDLDSCTFNIASNELTVVLSARTITAQVLLETLVGLRDPSPGRVTLNGHNLANVDTVSLRRMGIVMIETPKVLSVTLRRNIDLQQRYGDDDIEKAMRKTGLDKIVEKMPLGLNTILDSRSTSTNLATLVAATSCLLQDPKLVVAIDQPVMRNTAWGRNFITDLGNSQCTRVMATTNPELLAKANTILVFDDEGSLVAQGDLDHLRSNASQIPASIREVLQ